MMKTLEGLFFDLVKEDEVAIAHEIEKNAFVPEEAASLETFISRQSVAPKLFLGAYLPPRTLIAYANATLASSCSLTHESMQTHDLKGTSVCVHAIAVAEQYRRNGVARDLLIEYVRRLETNPDVGGSRVQCVLLICHEVLISLYTSVGFTFVGKSSVVHGPKEWFELRKDIESSALQDAAPSSVPPDVLTALMNSTRSRPSPRLYSSFPSPLDLVSSSGENKFDILCPRSGCGSIILKAGVAKFQTRESFELEPPDHSLPVPLQSLPSPPTQIDWWLVTPSPMAFENISFSRPVPSVSSFREVPRKKLLACAECELGPFGWSEAGGNEFWLAVSRVGYR